MALAQNWEDHDAKTNPIINYFADRQNTEIVLQKQERRIKKRCYYCKSCEACNKLKEYKTEFKKKGFWTFNKNIKIWNVYDPDWTAEIEYFH